MYLRLTLSLLLLLPTPQAQGLDGTIGYTARELNCAKFSETGQSKIFTESAGRSRRQTSSRAGLWQFRATASKEGVTLEAWLDSLSLSRRSPEAVISPDTDGLVGGRYRGMLSHSGQYTATVLPFVPDEVSEVADMSTALDDFFPPLPPKPLKQGQVWSDSQGLTISRLPDSTAAGTPLSRFQLDRRHGAESAPTATDTLPLKLQQMTEEHGRFVWHPNFGLLSRDRTIVVETTVPPSRTVRQTVRSRVEQHIALRRHPIGPRCSVSGGA
ncbi:MAG TPA: hypothetical protein VKA25_02810 [Gemmatimonadales bacterium]|nr:hypothetical protein [Gemmatimonadales bacterium]